MAYAFFHLPSDASPALAAGLNDFLRCHKVIRITREWSQEGAWAFCVEYVEGQINGRQEGATTKVDYKEVLTPEQFQIFARLRTLRKTLSERDGQPVFAIFTNAQLAEIAQRGCQNLNDLKEIAGIGEARTAKYGADVLLAVHGGERGAA